MINVFNIFSTGMFQLGTFDNLDVIGKRTRYIGDFGITCEDDTVIRPIGAR